MAVEQKSVTLSTGDLRYFEMGEGPAIVYLHGRSGLRVSPALEALSESHKILLPLTPGLEDTEHHQGVETMEDLADLVAEFIREKAGGECDVIGHSFGGWLTAWLAVRHPDLVELLILECPAGFRTSGLQPPAETPEEWRAQLYAYPERAPVGGSTFDQEAANRESVKHYHGGKPLDEELVAALPSIQSSTLILYGTEDKMIPEETCHILKDNIPRAFLNYIYDAGHMAEFDQPERFTTIVKDFLDRGEAFLVTQP